MSLDSYVTQLGQAARTASAQLMAATTEQKNDALHYLADLLDSNCHALIDVNKQDLDAAAKAGLSDAMIDRLMIDPQRVAAMSQGVRQVAGLPDPIGEISEQRSLESGITVAKMSSPLGVVCMIYESRPNVTIDAAVLCIKSGNAAILRGGKEAFYSNVALAQLVSTALTKAGLPALGVQLVDRLDREIVSLLISSPEYVDVVIPRGGRGLIERISKDARVPVIKHLDGVCHVYIDKAADLDRALQVVVNAKTQRYGTCNTTESLLVHVDAMDCLKPIAQALLAKGVEIRGCQRTLDLVADAMLASEQDWFTEYLAPVISIKVVDSLDEAIAHINHYGSHHTDAILTDDTSAAIAFQRRVDSGSVMVNASTRFADGFEYGLGAEIGISTDKFHARGPVALEGLCSKKWVVTGDYAVRA